jgi:hypothetical protein
VSGEAIVSARDRGWPRLSEVEPIG